MIVCQTLEEARAVQGVIHIEAGAQIRAYVTGDALPSHCVTDTLDTLIATALRRVDADVDAIYRDVIGNRAEEYRAAEADAQAYANAGYTGDVPPGVASWVAATSWSAQHAADDILATAAAWRAASADIREHRLIAKEQARAAADSQALAGVIAGWSAYVTAARVQLGI